MGPVAEHHVGAGINRRMCESFDIPSVFADKTFLTVGNMGLVLSFGPSMKRNNHYVSSLTTRRNSARFVTSRLLAPWPN